MMFEQIESHFEAPATVPAQVVQYPNIRQIFFDSVPYRGKPTRVFACYGLPEGASPESQAPGVVLIHGGGATALPDWVELWNRRGYAAISMDVCGAQPGWSPCAYSSPNWPRRNDSGPHGWGRVEAAEEPPEDQWVYHAVAAAVKGHSFLRSCPGVDPGKIGVTGISWGGFLTCIAASVDPRFRFSIPVYGCGFLADSPLLYEHPEATPARQELWRKLWDPGRFLPENRTPTLYFTGSNDFAFPLSALGKSFEATGTGEKYLAIRREYPHNHTECWQEPTIFAFAESILKGKAFPRPSAPELSGQTISAKLPCPGLRAELLFTRAEGYEQDRRWNAIPAGFDGKRAEALLPKSTVEAFFNFYDNEGCVFSSPLLKL